MQTTSQTLLQKLRVPNEFGSWDRFVQFYSPGLFSWARGMGLGQADAADLVQDVLLRLVRSLPQFQYDSRRSFRGWLWTLTRNEFVRRRDRIAQERLDEFEQRPEEPFWEEEYRKHMFRRILTIVENDFPVSTWRAFWEHVVEGKPASQVAAELGINRWAVYTAKVRVISHLHKELAEFAPS
jgi:RNA polymerase sigma-70 factor (ECF subfamily)